MPPDMLRLISSHLTARDVTRTGMTSRALRTAVLNAHRAREMSWAVARAIAFARRYLAARAAGNVSDTRLLLRLQKADAPHARIFGVTHPSIDVTVGRAVVRVSLPGNDTDRFWSGRTARFKPGWNEPGRPLPRPLPSFDAVLGADGKVTWDLRRLTGELRDVVRAETEHWKTGPPLTRNS